MSYGATGGGGGRTVIAKLNPSLERYSAATGAGHTFVMARFDAKSAELDPATAGQRGHGSGADLFYEYVVSWRIAMQRTDADGQPLPPTPEQTALQSERELLVQELREVGLLVQETVGSKRDQMFLKVGLDLEMLKTEAARMSMKMRVRDSVFGMESVYAEYDRRIDGEGMKIYKEQDEILPCLFSSSQRQQIVAMKMRAKKKMGGAQCDIESLISRGVISECFALHNEQARGHLKELWHGSWFGPLPLDEVHSYFGDSVAIYFAWVSFYTNWLLLPALLGLGLTVYSCHAKWDNPLVPGYCLFLSLWATLFLKYWKRQEISLAVRWGMMDYTATTKARPQFCGWEHKSPVTGQIELVYSNNRRLLKQAVSFAVLLLCVAAAVCCSIAIYVMRDQIAGFAGDANAGYASGAINALVIMVLNSLFDSVARSLTEWENHTTDEKFDDSLVTKTFVFQFVNSYVPLFLLAFVKGHAAVFGHNSQCSGGETKGNCMHELSEFLCSIMLVQLVLKHLLVATTSASGAFADSSSSSERTPLSEANPMSPEEKQATALGHYGTVFEEYNEMIFQFGYVTLFAAAFPLTSFFALANNMVEAHLDMNKLLDSFRRPDYVSAKNIGTWARVLDVMATGAVMTNVAMIGYTSSQLELFFPGISPTQRLLAVVLAEHAVIGAKLALEVSIPDMCPQEALHLRKLEHLKETNEEHLVIITDNELLQYAHEQN